MEMKRRSNLMHILTELGEHLPYSIFGVAVAILIMGILTYFAIIMKAQALISLASRELFHLFHPLHILLSAMVTTAMFWKNEKRLVKALIIGLVGSIAICAVSDILLPFFAGRLLGLSLELHVCLLEHPHIIMPFAVVGTLCGLLVPQIIEKSTQYSHSVHVFVSSMASLLYLISFGLTDWLRLVGVVFIITIIAVMLPCCLSDIVFPLIFVKENKEA